MPSVRRFRCSGCMNLWPATSKNLLGKEWYCRGCLSYAVKDLLEAQGKIPKAAPAESKKPPLVWYAAACEPGGETKVKTQILARSRRTNLYPTDVSRVLIPKVRQLVTKAAQWELADADTGEVLGSLGGEDEDDAVYKANNSPRLKDKIADKTVEVKLKKQAGERVFRNRTMFSGYVLIRMRYTSEAYNCVKGTYGVWDLLPLRPPLKGLRYPKKEPPQARKAQQWEKDANANWRPLGIPEEVANELVLKERERMSGPKAVKLPFKVGDEVRVCKGSFKGQVGEVITISGTNEDPIITILTRVLGHRVPITKPHDCFTL